MKNFSNFTKKWTWAGWVGLNYSCSVRLNCMWCRVCVCVCVLNHFREHFAGSLEDITSGPAFSARLALCLLMCSRPLTLNWILTLLHHYWVTIRCTFFFFCVGGEDVIVFITVLKCWHSDGGFLFSAVFYAKKYSKYTKVVNHLIIKK